MNVQVNSRWQGVERPYSEADVARLRGSVKIEYSLARLGAEKFWRLLHSEPVVAGLGCMTGNQAIQTVQAGGLSGPKPVSGRLGAENGRSY